MSLFPLSMIVFGEILNVWTQTFFNWDANYLWKVFIKYYELEVADWLIKFETICRQGKEEISRATLSQPNQ